MNGVLHAAVPGDVPPDSTQIFIRFDTRDADLAERFMARAIGKPFLRSVRAPGFYLSKSEFDSVLELAATEGAISLHERLSPHSRAKSQRLNAMEPFAMASRELE
jgi:hypothetical protein